MNVLDIIVPQYNESEDMVSNLLESINVQQNVDFNTIGIIIVNDCSNVKLTNKLFDKYSNLNIKYLLKDTNEGPGLTRQYGIDNSNAKYIMFIDADDRLLGKDTLDKIISLINRKSPEAILTNFLEEVIVNNSRSFFPHKPDMTYLHGKIFNREVLVKNDFRFSSKLRVHEDSYFNTIVFMNIKKVESLNINSYLWTSNKNSITKAKSKYHYLVNTFDTLATSILEVRKELLKRKTMNYEEFVIKGVFFMYYILHAPFFNIKNDKVLLELKNKAEYKIYEVLLEVIEDFISIPKEKIALYKDEELAEYKKSLSLVGNMENWDDFVNRLSKQFD